jgi:ABC-type polysaccharide/polyol phosphate transport system ATPase subunit/SAM-dependent methyltransferase
VVGVSKTFRLPREVRTTLKERVLHPLEPTVYDEVRALDDVTFEIGSGEFFGVIGRNGSGKSTLLRILADIYRPDRGHVAIEGRLSPFIELGVGFNPELSGRDNIRVNGVLMGLTARELNARFDAIVEFSELRRFIDQKLKNYSSGMQLRLAFAVALQVPFDVLLLDEVLAVGDEAFQRKCFRVFEELRERGKTVVLVSHGLESVKRFCDRAMLLQEGVVQAIGPPDEVIDLYRERERVRLLGVGSPSVLPKESPPEPEPKEEHVAPPAGGEAFADDPQLVAELRELVREQEARLTDRGSRVSDLPSVGELRELVRHLQNRLDHREARLVELGHEVGVLRKEVRDRDSRLADRERRLRELAVLRAEIDEFERRTAQLTRMSRALIHRRWGEVPLPPEHLRARVSPRVDEMNFLAQGLESADAVLDVVPEPHGPMLEWGCDCGRLTRWLTAEPGWLQWYTACDPNEEAAAWVEAHLKVPVRVGGEQPPLPFAPSSFDLVLALAPLLRTHPTQLSAAFEELRRILRPGGTALASVNGEPVVSALKRLDDQVREEFAAEGRLWTDSTAVVSESFVRGAAHGILEVTRFAPLGHKTMDLYVLRAVA